jgi:hypothetical protein
VKVEGVEERKGGLGKVLMSVSSYTIVPCWFTVGIASGARSINLFPPVSLSARTSCCRAGPYRAYRGRRLSTPHPQGEACALRVSLTGRRRLRTRTQEASFHSSSGASPLRQCVSKRYGPTVCMAPRAHLQSIEEPPSACGPTGRATNTTRIAYWRDQSSQP